MRKCPEVMSEFGLQYAELQFLWDKMVADLDAAEVKTVKDLLATRDMHVPCISPHCFSQLSVMDRSTNDAEYRKQMNTFKRCVDIAHVLGSPLVRIMGFRREMVLFGSGRFLADGDKTRSNTQSFYGVWDNNTGGLTRSNLARQTFLLDDASKRARVLDPYLKVEYEKMTGRQYGWYIDLPADTGERVVSDAVARGDLIFFDTLWRFAYKIADLRDQEMLEARRYMKKLHDY